MTETTNHEALIITAATNHGGRFLLARRDEYEATPLWQAARRLVITGRARWIPRNSLAAPGIDLVDALDV